MTRQLGTLFGYPIIVREDAGNQPSRSITLIDANRLRFFGEMAKTPRPTEEGKRRHEPNGFYTPDSSEPGSPCTCKPECPHACKGECGCEACHDAYSDYLSTDYD